MTTMTQTKGTTLSSMPPLNSVVLLETSQPTGCQATERTKRILWYKPSQHFPLVKCFFTCRSWWFWFVWVTQDFEKDVEREGGGLSDSDMDDNVGWSTVNLDEEKVQADVSLPLTSSTVILLECGTFSLTWPFLFSIIVLNGIHNYSGWRAHCKLWSLCSSASVQKQRWEMSQIWFWTR